MRVRAAEPKDRDTLVAMRVALWPSDGTETEHRADVDALLAGKPHSALPLVNLVAEDERGAVVGFIEVGLRSHAESCDPMHACGFIEGWFVDEAHRRCGVGGTLVRAAEDWARAQGCVDMASDTWHDATHSVRAHEALGYAVVERLVCFHKKL